MRWVAVFGVVLAMGAIALAIPQVSNLQDKGEVLAGGLGTLFNFLTPAMLILLAFFALGTMLAAVVMVLRGR